MIQITIVRDTTTGEHIVRHPCGRAADYFTNDRDDATGTALSIAESLGFEPNDVEIVRKVRR